MRFLLAVMLVAGCGFEHGELSASDTPDGGFAGGGGGGGGSGTGGGSGSGSGTPTPVARTCRYPDAQLRLCFEFDDAQVSPVMHDGSSGQLDAQATGVNVVMRATNDPAAAVTSGSSIAIGESSALDISGPITIEAWVKPTVAQSASVLRNEGQYVLLIDGLGHVGCSMAGTNLTSYNARSIVRAGVWTHVACTYDGERLYAYINGTTADCSNGSYSAISTLGTQGVRIAPNLRGAIDGIRIYARRLDTSELCTHAGLTGCQATCQTPD